MQPVIDLTEDDVVDKSPERDKVNTSDADPEDPGLVADPEKNRIRILKKQNFDQSHHKMIRKFSTL